ncbi:MAG: hypothetical protein A9183_07155 [Dehalococcoides mccartyi]|uniref:hypothetical protein n=1 Tax=Dehalococcoides mccartyi TaxID=61435 RepID=UPI000805801B|nr:hypothetical protein [Dehalococcoides mccartyi]OBW63492.1 MAG: hypothetical protein A9183_07155 [Dehalococcoides mccartyi]
MPIHNFNGETFVAFMDLCGFKELMRTEDKAWRALDSLYTTGYRVLRENNNQNQIEGIFVSDCGVLFVRRNQQQGISVETDLESLLLAVKNINEAMLNVDLMLTTSIAYGQFRYQERIEFIGIEKNPIYGNAYASAYFDNANGNPRIQPGQCRLIKKGFPAIRENNLNAGQFSDFLRERAGDSQHYYFYWNVLNPDEIDGFEERYKDAYNMKFQGMLRALKR